MQNWQPLSDCDETSAVGSASASFSWRSRAGRWLRRAMTAAAIVAASQLAMQATDAAAQVSLVCKAQITSRTLAPNVAVTPFVPVVADGGVTPFTYIISPAPPAGMTFDTTSGTLSGTPTTPQPATTYFVTVTDAASGTATASFSLSVSTAVVATVSVPNVSFVKDVPMAVAPVTFTGGTTPYQITIAPALPAGLSLSSRSGIISGKPTAVLTASKFTVTATDANGGTAHADFTLTIAAIAAVDDSATTSQGYPVTVDVTGNDIGGPFTAVQVASAPAHGTATVSGLSIVYSPDPQFVGTDSFTYRNTGGTATSAPATVNITVNARPDPSNDKTVVGLIQAQTQAATQMAETQIDNFNSRMDALHGDGYATDSQGVTVQSGLPSERPGATSAFAEEKAATEKTEAARQATGRALSKEDKTLDRAVNRMKALESAFSIWSAGSIRVGRLTGGNQVDSTHLSSSGLSLGADYRLNRFLSIGLGTGLGATQADIGSDGSNTRARAYNLAAYAVLRPTDYSFIDALIGYGVMDFTSKRFISADGTFATGKRNGSEVFGALSAGLQYRSAHWLLEPYTRLQFVQGTLGAFTEAGSAGNTLAFNRQTFGTSSLNLGFKGKFTETFDLGNQTIKASPFVRAEFQHDLTRTASAGVSWADIPGTQVYSVSLPGVDNNRILFGLGTELDIEGFLLLLEYQNTFGKTSETQTLRAKLSRRF